MDRRRALLGAMVVLVGVLAGSNAARAECGDEVTDDRCDFGDRAIDRRPAESFGSYFARKQAEAERQYASPDPGVGSGGRGSRRR
jgi:hypothetical protein